MKHGQIIIETTIEAANGDSVNVKAVARNGEYAVEVSADSVSLDGRMTLELVRVLADMHTRMEKEISKENEQ